MPTLTAVIQRDPESGWYIGSVPQLPGAYSQAATLEELRERLEECVRGMMTDILEHGDALPEI